MKNKKISMQDIADRLQISKNAVSLALSGKPGVSEETRELVIALAKKLNYGNNTQQRTNGSNKNILILIPEYIRNDSIFYNDIYWSIDYRIAQKGYVAVITTVTETMQQKNLLPTVCVEMEFIGCLLVGIVNRDYLRFLCNQNFRLISVDQNYYGIDCKNVGTNNIDGAYRLTKQVLAFGHRKIGFVGSYGVTSSIYERWCGFQLAMQEAGLFCPHEFSITADSPICSLMSDADELYTLLQKCRELPTAFVCGGDRIAIALISALKQMGYQVPEQISVVGFDDIEMSQYVHPALTTMHVRRKEMGSLAVDLLLKTCDDKHTADHLELTPFYVKRESLTWAANSGNTK